MRREGHSYEKKCKQRFDQVWYCVENIPDLKLVGFEDFGCRTARNLQTVKNVSRNLQEKLKQKGITTKVIVRINQDYEYFNRNDPIESLDTENECSTFLNVTITGKRVEITPDRCHPENSPCLGTIPTRCIDENNKETTQICCEQKWKRGNKCPSFCKTTGDYAVCEGNDDAKCSKEDPSKTDLQDADKGWYSKSTEDCSKKGKKCWCGKLFPSCKVGEGNDFACPKDFGYTDAKCLENNPAEVDRTKYGDKKWSESRYSLTRECNPVVTPGKTCWCGKSPKKFCTTTGNNAACPKSDGYTDAMCFDKDTDPATSEPTKYGNKKWYPRAAKDCFPKGQSCWCGQPLPSCKVGEGKDVACPKDFGYIDAMCLDKDTDPTKNPQYADKRWFKFYFRTKDCNPKANSDKTCWCGLKK